MSDSLWAAFDGVGRRVPDKRALVFLRPGRSAQVVTHGELREDVARVARWFGAQGLAAGEVVSIDCGHGYETVLAFFACIQLGAVPSIFAHPATVGRQRQAERHAAQVDEGGLDALVCLADDKAVLEQALTRMSRPCRVLALPPVADLPAGSRAPATTTALDTAWVQFSSGTTGPPRGVVLIRGGVIAHLAALVRGLQFGHHGVSVGALPLFHDMGLVIQVVLPVMIGATSVLIPPHLWALRPSLMLRAVHDYGGTMTWMPNFGFSHCSRVGDKDVEGVDLSSWALVGNGAEPTDRATIDRFVRRFRPLGLRANAVRVGYGLAENVVAVTVTPPAGELHAARLDPTALSQGRAVSTVAPRGSVSVMSCGKPFPGTELRVVDEAGRTVGEARIGEVLLRGSSMFSHYHRDARATAAAFVDGWFRTGDLGFVSGGELYVTDRKKDLIIVGGRNIQPRAIEDVVKEVAPDVLGDVVAFGVWNPEKGTEDAIVVYGLRRRLGEDDRRKLGSRVRARVQEELGLALADVLVVGRGWVVKTTSGKTGRAANRAKYEEVSRRASS